MEHLEISTEVERLDVDRIHRFLSEESYWARGRTREMTQQAIDNSICFGAYLGRQQVGFARVVSDQTTFAWLADVFILVEYRGQGYGKALVAAVLDHPELQGLRWLLATKDAHGLYAQNGFAPVPPERFMERRTPQPL
ncbi:MAG: GNAT family N-acetyltransferase [Anaerolineae bacterium]|uniref:GNAT family N-acetyltransferase n=1 Tax=Promineifilum sp. TaxID=2664178 RepID=UPI001E0CFA4C|nr:GNAT family N-acetyltransferase [Anaerolineales bacterium]MCB8935536.1 GNAT family N-acetyltransferase [Promineifilum sp.]MCO5181317.1 GNAT family N-acetyltransferase [Promineifilum sp.]MCW5847296.1 GNAT family N-acetyltransferase [Anaerolineae bacterium]